MSKWTSWAALALWSCAAVACDTATLDPAANEGQSDLEAGQLDEALCPEELPYATEVVSFTPGLHAGFGQANLPDIVLGPPAMGPPSAGSMDVLSLGVGGEIVLGFGDRQLIDGPGADLVVWENAFWISGDEDNPYAEMGEVAVSEDGETWKTFSCSDDLEGDFDPGCAGWRPRYDFDPCGTVPLEPEIVGGDAFDLADVGLRTARYVRIRDLAVDGVAPSAGFDLDAIGGVHFAP